jgi:hypothetical protein
MFLMAYNIEFSCAAESLGLDVLWNKAPAFWTQSKASAATICYTQDYSFSYWSFTYPAASCGNRRGRYRQTNIPNHTNLALPAYSSCRTKGILVERPFPMKQIALILKARAYRYAIPGPRRSILIFNPKHDHSPQSCISQKGYSIELSCPANHRTAATVHLNDGDIPDRPPRGQLQRFVRAPLAAHPVPGARLGRQFFEF